MRSMACDGSGESGTVAKPKFMGNGGQNDMIS